MRVAVVVNSLKIGGMERVACNLSDSFAQQHHDTHLIYLKNRTVEVKPDDPRVKVHLFSLQKIAALSVIGFFWLIICKILNFIFRKSFIMFFAFAESIAFTYKLKKIEKQSGRFDLIIFRGQGTFSHIWPLKDPRFVFVCESMQNKNLYGKQSRIFYSWLFSNRRMVCISNQAHVSFLDLLETHKITCKSISIISNPNNYEKIREKSLTLEKNAQYHNKPYLLGLGRLVKGKNFLLLIDAYDYARQHYNVTHDLVIVGEGPEKNNIKEKINHLNLESHVYLKGQYKNPFPWYRNADLFVLSSKSEGLGMVLIEALACGTPVVSTNCPGGVSDIMLGSLKQNLAEQTKQSLAMKIAEILNKNEDISQNQDVMMALNQFDDKYIVQKYSNTFF